MVAVSILGLDVVPLDPDGFDYDILGFTWRSIW